MKLKTIKIIGIVLPMILFMTSCSEEFLEVDPKGTTLEENYYTNEAEAYFWFGSSL